MTDPTPAPAAATATAAPAPAARRYRLHLEPLDPLCFSRDARTAGDHSTLDRIPGANLWGYLAAALYGAAHPCADTAAYGRGLRLSDGYPVAPSGQPAWPMPLSLHFDKTRPDQPPVVGRLLRPTHVLDGIAGSLSSMGQARGVRDGYVSLHGEVVHPGRELVMRTAVAEDERAARGQLYGKEGLTSGLCFVADLHVADPDLDEAVRACLGEPGQTRELRIGHSRRTEYGGLRCRIEGVAKHSPLLGQPGQANRIVLWLLADACLQEPDGSPALLPLPATLGLPTALADAIELEPARCFVRHRSHGAYNRHRGCHGLERQCLSAGSVLVYSIKADAQGRAHDIRAALADGIGILGELGFGRVWVDPPLLGAADGRPALLELPQPQTGDDGAAVNPTDATLASTGSGRNAAMLAWARSRAGAPRGLHDREAWVAERMLELRSLISQSRAYAGVAPHLPHGPKASQWGRLERQIRDAADLDAAMDKLVLRADAMLRPSDQYGDDEHERTTTWLAPTGDPAHATLADWIKAQLEPQHEAGEAGSWASHQQALCLLARRAREADLGAAAGQAAAGGGREAA